MHLETCVLVFVIHSLSNYGHNNKPITSFNMGDKPAVKETLTEGIRQVFVEIESIALIENAESTLSRLLAVALRMHQTLTYCSLDNQCEY